jgi:hypothetical protein
VRISRQRVASSQYGQGSGRANRNPMEDMMNPMKRAGLKLFGLCVLAFGLVAFSATAAQAEGTWMYKGTDLTSTAQNKTLLGKLDKLHGVLLTMSGLNSVTILCTEVELLNTKLEPEGKVSENSKDAKADFSGCVVWINGKIAKSCEPFDKTTKAPGIILTEELYGLLQLHPATGDAITVIKPKASSLLAVIYMSESCVISEELKVFGQLALKDSGGNAGLLEEKLVHLVEEFAPLTELKTAHGPVEAKATLDGGLEAWLTSDEVWNGLYK